MQAAEQKWQQFCEGVSLLFIDYLDIHWLTWIHSLWLWLSLSLSSTHIAPYTSTKPSSQTHTRVSQSVKALTHLRRVWETEPWFSPSAAVQPQTPAKQHNEQTLSFNSYTHSLTQPLRNNINDLMTLPSGTKRKRHLSESLLTCRKPPVRGRTKHPCK